MKLKNYFQVDILIPFLFIYFLYGYFNFRCHVIYKVNYNSSHQNQYLNYSLIYITSCVATRRVNFELHNLTLFLKSVSFFQYSNFVAGRNDHYFGTVIKRRLCFYQFIQKNFIFLNWNKCLQNYIFHDKPFWLQANFGKSFNRRL